VSEALGQAMDRLTDGLKPHQVAAIKHAESVLCTVYRQQFEWGTLRCYKLRSTLTSLVRKASDL
jgi:hypothetical protein